MTNEEGSDIPVECPLCNAVNHLCITHAAHHPLCCGGCGESFKVDQTLIERFYASDDSACHILEALYRAQLVDYFFNRGELLTDAEKLHIDVFTKVWETKHPRPGNNPQRYDRDHPSGASFRTWL